MPPKTRSEEEYASLAQVNKLLQKQKEVFTAMLQQQKDNFQSFIKVIMDSTNSRFDSLTKELQDIKSSLQFTQKDVDEMKTSAVKQNKECEIMDQKVRQINDSLSMLAAKVDYLEGLSKRNNLIIDGIAETPGETWADSEDKVKKMFNEKLQLNRHGGGKVSSYWES